MIEIKNITKIEDLKRLTEVQRNAWGFQDLEIEPHHLMTRVQKYGGLIQGLFIDEVLIGLTYAIIGKWKGEYFLYSHMTAVMKEYQGQGFGFKLKKAQREGAVKMGYDIMRWNFDPLESLNAYFNIHRLGVISEEYDRNIYGIGESGLHKGLSTDRLIATWHLKSDRVVEKMRKKDPPTLEEVPFDRVENLDYETAYIETPMDIHSIKERNINEATALRIRQKEFFETAFQKGFTVVDIVFSKDKKRIFFKLIISLFFFSPFL